MAFNPLRECEQMSIGKSDPLNPPLYHCPGDSALRRRQRDRIYTCKRKGGRLQESKRRDKGSAV